MMTLAELESILTHTFSEPMILVEALTHTSFGHENKTPHNERLEFLGDSVLNAATTALLYYPNRHEGALSGLRARLVTETLATIAMGLGLGSALRLGVGEEASGGEEAVYPCRHPRGGCRCGLSRRGSVQGHRASAAMDGSTDRRVASKPNGKKR